MKRIVVVGGGISGLATAHRLAELVRRGLSPQGTVPDLRVTLLEGRGRLGGVIETCTQDGFLLEAGPDAFLTEKPWAVDLCRRIGLEDELLGTNPQFRRSYIAQGQKLLALPEGFALAAPIRWKALMCASVLSLPAKLRAARERWIRPAAGGQDESVADFMRRRFGREVLEQIGWPLIGGIYAADLERLSVQAALPRYRDLELRYGSVIKGLQAASQGNGSAASAATRAAGPAPQRFSGGPRYGLFLTLLGGMSRLVQALAAAMPEVEMRTSARVVALERPETGPQWRIRLEAGETLDADAICLALPPREAAELLRPISQELAERLGAIGSVSVATVSLAYRKEDVPRALDGFGFVVDGRKGEGLIGCTFSSVKFAGRAPEGSVLLRAFVGGALFPEAAEENDAGLARLVRRHLKRSLGIEAAPRLVWIRRFTKAMPQYEVGHLQRMDAIEALAGRIPGLYLTGNGYRGVGVAGCVQQAEAAAEEIASSARFRRASSQ